jgi:hypothetical protein
MRQFLPSFESVVIFALVMICTLLYQTMRLLEHWFKLWEEDTRPRAEARRQAKYYES